ncbi:MAG: hypothetical protein EA408_03930 [Marinilabiliales bacterium]|nr:MAG: hypothetical protein EA408_03930 [Marinilabiliales bacterium]
MDEQIDKYAVLRAMISVIKDDAEPDKILARDLEGYESPQKIVLGDKYTGFVPDMIVYYDEAVDIYEVETSSEIHIEKWQDMQSYARKHNGNLYLVVPDVAVDVIRKALENNDVNAGLLYFNT